MPTYTYHCPNCSYTFDQFHSITDNSPRRCPKCGSIAQHSISGGIGLIFKGSGFYETDYKSKSRNFDGPGQVNARGNGGNGRHDHQPAKSESGEKADRKGAPESKPAGDKS